MGPCLSIERTKTTNVCGYYYKKEEKTVSMEIGNSKKIFHCSTYSKSERSDKYTN